MNNTAVVAMFIPTFQDWAQRLGAPSSRLLLPMSYAAILGGACTLIGTTPTWWWMVTDYVRLGFPLSLLVGSTAIGLIPFVWGF